MKPTLWFVVPVHRRLELAAICLRQLRRTCLALREEGIVACGVLVGARDELTVLRRATDGFFASIERDNAFLGRKFNDGIMLACDERYNPQPAHFVVPCGSDDWVDHRLFTDLPPQDTIVGFKRMSFVSEDGTEMISAQLNYRGGSGIRIIPRSLVEPFRFRPADEDRCRACDTNILSNLSLFYDDKLKVEHHHLHDRQIIDWKTNETQLNSFEIVHRMWRAEKPVDPFTDDLMGIYPQEALEEMADYYAERLVPA